MEHFSAPLLFAQKEYFLRILIKLDSMITTLILLFLILIVTITTYMFHLAFVRGEIYDITKMKLGKDSKLKKYVNEFHSNIEQMEKLPYQWHYIQSDDGLLLAGRLYLCENSHKIVILFHGYRSIAENDFSAYFRWYHEHGYSILLVDQRAHGRSEGTYITFGVKERVDCQKWCEYVSEHFSEFDQIVVAGISMGATTVLLASGLSLSSKVKGIVSDSAFTSPKDIICKVARSNYGIDAKVLLPFLNLFCLKKAHFNITECSVLEALKKNELPVLLIHALSDDFVPSKMTKEIYESCHSPKEMVLVDCVTHGFSYVYGKEKIENALEQFLKSLA